MSNNFHVSSVNNQVNQGSYLKSTIPESPSEEIVKNFEDTMTVSSDSIQVETGPMTQADVIKDASYAAGSKPQHIYKDYKSSENNSYKLIDPEYSQDNARSLKKHQKSIMPEKILTAEIKQKLG